MRLGRRDDTLSGGEPVATFRFVTGRLKGEMVFLTDRDRLQELNEGIRAALDRSIAGTSSGREDAQ
jgi:hypothetical protein